MFCATTPRLRAYAAVVGSMEQHQETCFATDSHGTMYCRRCQGVAKKATITICVVAEKSPHENIRQEPLTVYWCGTCEQVSQPPSIITCCV